MGVHEFFHVGCPGTMTLLISASHIAGWQACATIPCYWLRCNLTNFLTRLAILQISVSQVPRIIGMSHLALSGDRVLLTFYTG
jgi:hypothetical protein